MRVVSLWRPMVDLFDLSRDAAENDIRSSDVHPGTVDGVKRRLGFLQTGNNRIFVDTITTG